VRKKWEFFVNDCAQEFNFLYDWNRATIQEKLLVQVVSYALSRSKNIAVACCFWIKASRIKSDLQTQCPKCGVQVKKDYISKYSSSNSYIYIIGCSIHFQCLEWAAPGSRHGWAVGMRRQGRDRDKTYLRRNQWSKSGSTCAKSWAIRWNNWRSVLWTLLMSSDCCQNGQMLFFIHSVDWTWHYSVLYWVLAMCAYCLSLVAARQSCT